MIARADSRRRAAALAIAAAAFGAFLPVLWNGFTNFDDDEYVTENPSVKAGLTLEGVRWAWTTGHAANWHPLTWMSHQIDAAIYGESAWGHHLTSLLLHVANALLVFTFLRSATGAVGRSAFAAALFAVHPLRVESVAWVAERKDVLSTLFGLLALVAYGRYVAAPSPRRMAAVAGLLALGLLAKPMLVTLPFVLLLLDEWPLRRWWRREDETPARIWRRRLSEKAPLFVLAAASCVVTVVVQRSGRALQSSAVFGWSDRLANAAVAYWAYLRQTVWPAGLAPFYPHEGARVETWTFWLASLGLLVVTGAAIRWRRTAPYVFTGWLWFVGTLVPAIGLVQVGEQARADRYTYLPSIGLAILLSWGIPEVADRLLRERAPSRIAWTASAAILVAALVPITWMQATRWKDSTTLFQQALAVTERNATAHINLAIALGRMGRLGEAEQHLREAVRIAPDDSVARNNLGNVLYGQGRLGEAEEQFAKAARLDPRNALALANLGIVARDRGDLPAAEESFHRAIAVDPACQLAHAQLGLALARAGDLQAAAASFREAARLRPDDVENRYNLGTALANLRRYEEAEAELEAVVRAQPTHARAHSNLAACLYQTGRFAEAWYHVHRARQHGYEPAPSFIELLSSKMPDPAARGERIRH